MTNSFEHVVHVYGRPADAPVIRLDHELEAGETVEWEGRSMRVVAARSEDREDGRVRVVHLEPVTAQ